MIIGGVNFFDFVIESPKDFVDWIVESLNGGLTLFVNVCFNKVYEINRRSKLWNEVNDILEKKIPLVCPREGSFIGYKKGFKMFITDELYADTAQYKYYNYEEVLITLEIPAEAKRSSAFGRKCRCSEAKVLDMVGITSGKHYKSAQSFFDHGYCYFLGQTMLSDSFDENRWNECSHGIHFFMTEDEARDYEM